VIQVFTGCMPFYHLPNNVKTLKGTRLTLSIYYINGRRLSVMEVRTFAAAGCAWSAHGDALQWEVGVAGWVRSLHRIFRRCRWRAMVVARQAAGRSGRCASTGGFLVAV